MLPRLHPEDIDISSQETKNSVCLSNMFIPSSVTYLEENAVSLLCAPRTGSKSTMTRAFFFFELTHAIHLP